MDRFYLYLSRFTSLARGQSYDFPIVSEVTLNYMNTFINAKLLISLFQETAPHLSSAKPLPETM